MAAKNWHFVTADLAKVWSTPDRKGYLRTVLLGDAVDVVAVTPEHVEVRITRYTKAADGSVVPEAASGFIVPSKKAGLAPADVVKKTNDVLKVNFVDVQQGDGAMIETPKGRVMLVDGGDNAMFARYLAGRWRTTAAKPKTIDCILVTHGDADHFEGLTQIHESETYQGKGPESEWKWKRLFIQPRRVYHNGLVKRPEKKADGGKRKEVEMLGATVDHQGRAFIVGLEEDLLSVPEAELNRPFKEWQAALADYNQRAVGAGKPPLEIRRLEKGSQGAFDFLGSGVQVEVLGPLVTQVQGQPALPFLGEPSDDIGVGTAATNPENKKFTGKSASHTINGHSVILRLTYGNVHVLLAGDLNEEAELALLAEHQAGTLDLRAEVFKVPHHGSADFSSGFVDAVSPVISVVSAGDESARKEYIHPRATLMSAVGRAGRPGSSPVVFVTELVAFFSWQDWVEPEVHQVKDGVVKTADGLAVIDPKAKKPFFAFRRDAFGLVRVRTDGRRLLVATDSGNVKLKEAYAYEVAADGTTTAVRVREA